MGRKSIADGGKSSPREIFVVCLGSPSKSYKIDGGKDDTNAEILARASQIYKAEFQKDPDSLEGPFYPRKGVASSQVKPPQKEEFDLSTMKIIPNRTAVGQYKDWTVSVKFIEGNPDIGFIFYKSTDPAKSTPKSHIVKLTEIKNITE